MNPATELSNQSNERECRPDRPRRPLSAFNLFYRYKRQKVLAALESGDSTTKSTLCDLVRIAPGLEHYHTKEPGESPETLNALQRKNILAALASNMNAKDTKTRQHRKNGAMNGLIGFVELGKLMNDCWKSCDPFAKSVFNELSQVQRDRYRQLMLEFNDKTKGQEESTKVSKKKKRKYSKKKLPTKKNSASDSPDESEEEVNEYTLAETMLELTKRAPSNIVDKKSCPSINTNDNKASPSLLDLLSNKKYPNDEGSQIKTVADNNSRQHVPDLSKPTAAKKSVQSAPIRSSKLIPKVLANPVFSSTRSIEPPRPPNNTPNEPSERPTRDNLAVQTTVAASAPVNQGSLMPTTMQMQPGFLPPRVGNGTGDVLTLGLAARIRELENQLAAERLRLRIRELETEMSARRVREGALRSVLDNVVTHERATAASIAAATAAAQARRHPPMEDGLWSLMSTRMIHPSVASAERAAMLTRMVQPHRAMSTKRTLSVTPEEGPEVVQSKKLRLN